jgi:hypothetical protein
MYEHVLKSAHVVFAGRRWHKAPKRWHAFYTFGLGCSISSYQKTGLAHAWCACTEWRTPAHIVAPTWLAEALTDSSEDPVLYIGNRYRIIL